MICSKNSFFLFFMGTLLISSQYSLAMFEASQELPKMTMISLGDKIKVPTRFPKVRPFRKMNPRAAQVLVNDLIRDENLMSTNASDPGQASLKMKQSVWQSNANCTLPYLGASNFGRLFVNVLRPSETFVDAWAREAKSHLQTGLYNVRNDKDVFDSKTFVGVIHRWSGLITNGSVSRSEPVLQFLRLAKQEALLFSFRGEVQLDEGESADSFDSKEPGGMSLLGPIAKIQSFLDQATDKSVDTKGSEHLRLGSYAPEDLASFLHLLTEVYPEQISTLRAENTKDPAEFLSLLYGTIGLYAEEKRFNSQQLIQILSDLESMDRLSSQAPGGLIMKRICGNLEPLLSTCSYPELSEIRKLVFGFGYPVGEEFSKALDHLIRR